MSTTDVKRKTLDADTKAVGDRTIQFVLSTGARDREGDTISPSGWKLANFKKNPTVLWAHSHRDLPVARASDVHVEGDRLVATAEFVPGSIYPHAETVFQMLRAGFLRAVSVGFRPLKWKSREDGVDFTETELLEFSVVPVPAHPDALIVGRGADVAAVKSWLSSDDEVALELADDPDDEPAVELDAEALAWARGLLAMRRQNAAHRVGLLDEPRFEVDRHDVASAVAEVVQRGLRDVTREAISRELRRLRGRVD